MNLKKRWKRWLATPFPDGLAGEEIAGVFIASADSYAAGCIERHLSSHALSAEHRDALTDILRDLRRVSPRLDWPRFHYVQELADIVEQVLLEAVLDR